MTSRAAGASCPPTASAAAAAIRTGTKKAIQHHNGKIGSLNTFENGRQGIGEGETRKMQTQPYLLPITSEMNPQRTPPKTATIPMIANILPAAAIHAYFFRQVGHEERQIDQIRKPIHEIDAAKLPDFTLRHDSAEGRKKVTVSGGALCSPRLSSPYILSPFSCGFILTRRKQRNEQAKTPMPIRYHA